LKTKVAAAKVCKKGRLAPKGCPRFKSKTNEKVEEMALAHPTVVASKRATILVGKRGRKNKHAPPPKYRRREGGGGWGEKKDPENSVILKGRRQPKTTNQARNHRRRQKGKKFASRPNLGPVGKMRNRFIAAETENSSAHEIALSPGGETSEVQVFKKKEKTTIGDLYPSK